MGFLVSASLAEYHSSSAKYITALQGQRAALAQLTATRDEVSVAEAGLRERLLLYV